MAKLVGFLNGIVWSNALVYLCLGAGLFYSIGTRFAQVRHLKEMVVLMFSGKSSDKGVSSFQALSLALSARVGTGNIAGVAAAIAFGGPGAVFWMWVLAFLGAATSFVECSLAQVYKVELDGQYRGGTAYYIEKALGIKWYAAAFAIANIFAMGATAPGVQANAIAAALDSSFGIAPIVTGIVLAGIMALIIFGGVKRIARIAEFMVPFMAIAYILVAVIIIIINASKVPEVFGMIVGSAFGKNAVFGGIIGSAISWGVKRGIYSNEAGLGTATQAAGAAEVSHPAKQGLVQAFSVYIDTLFVCSATAFMILMSGAYNVHQGDGFIVENLPGVEAGPVFTIKAVESVFSGFGSAFIAIALFFFAFTTLIAASYFGETNVAYLFRKRDIKLPVAIFRIGFIATTLVGALRTADLAWALGDLGFGLMAWLNLGAIFLLSKIAFKVLKDYEDQKAQGLDPVFDPDKIGIKNADLWMKLKKEYTK
ncbi:alanine/glycine:cation symporter family protein [Wukongibacter baidiensis]|uniref:alanine/glycine:cation symporter family protein n=1 Tax=Wukongibacter baidiensis TaxID=1723361 RepID=UPI003D7F7C57